MKKNLRIRIISLLIAGLALLPGIGFGMNPGPEIVSALNGITIGSPVTYRNLTLYPLISHRSGIGGDYLTLDEAMERDYLRVEEKSGGTVPEVMVTNRSSRPVFIFAGEIIAGAKQDRIVRQDALLAPCGGRMSLSVYCVEQGRWSGTSDKFEASYYNAGAHLRRIAQTGASQATVWDGVKKKNREMGVAPSSGTLRAVYTSRENRKIFDEYKVSLGCLPDMSRGTVGVVVCSGGEIICGDIFGSPGLFRAEWKKLLTSYITDGATGSRCGRPVEGWRIESFLSHLRSPGSVARERGVSLGENLRLNWAGGVAAGLLYRGYPVHISIFPQAGGGDCSAPGGVIGTRNRVNLSR